jgi:hypothetical protein
MEAVANNLELIEKISPYKQRFSDAVWYERLRSTYILLIGAGGIGSWVAFCLSRIGCNFTLYDMDVVEAHNLGGQLYSMQHVGQLKTEATKALCAEFTGKENDIDIQSRYDDSAMSNPIVIAAFDNMEGRKLAFTKWVELVESDPENVADYLFIDGRLLAEQYQVFAVTPDRIEEYKKYLFSDAEVGEVSCSLKSTTHCSMGIASDIISVLTNFVANRALGFDIREVPFKVEKLIDLFLYELDFNNGEEKSRN